MYPKKIFNIIGLKLTRVCNLRLNFLPYSLDIEPTIRCNLKCPMCQVSDWGRESPDLSFEGFKKIIDDNPLLVKIKLQGMGEPFLNKDFFRMVDYAESKKILVHTTTNGMLLEGGILERVVDTALRRIYISIDSASCVSYRSIREGGDLERVKRNVARLVRARRSSRKGRLEIYIWMVGMKVNIHELPNMVELVRELAVDGLFLQTKLSFWGKREWTNRLANLSINEGEYREVINSAKGKANGLRIKFIEYRGNEFSMERRDRCPWPWRSAFITADGFVCPCCIATDPRRFNLGNIHKETFFTLWNNEKYIALREAIYHDRLFEICKDCYKEYYAEVKDNAHYS